MQGIVFIARDYYIVHNSKLKKHICIENKYFTPKTAFYKALTADYLDINRELNNHQACHNYFVKKPKIFKNVKSKRAAANF